jgi:hypothetical protein
MQVVVHRVNTIEALRAVPVRFGAEIDLRADGSRIVMHHDPFVGGEDFDRWLENYRHGLLVLNIKEAGIEAEVLRRVRTAGVAEYFLLDVEFPYLYRASRTGERAIAVRYSEDEPLQLLQQYKARVDWAWIDTNTRLPLDAPTVAALAGIRTCLVCPERWGRPHDIEAYQRSMRELGFRPDAVMTASRHAASWEAFDRDA